MASFFEKKFVNDVIIGNPDANAYFKQISSNPNCVEIVELYYQKMQQLQEIDKSNPTYLSELRTVLQGIPGDNFIARNKAVMAFNLKWIERNQEMNR